MYERYDVIYRYKWSIFLCWPTYRHLHCIQTVQNWELDFLKQTFHDLLSYGYNSWFSWNLLLLQTSQGKWLGWLWQTAWKLFKILVHLLQQFKSKVPVSLDHHFLQVKICSELELKSILLMMMMIMMMMMLMLMMMMDLTDSMTADRT